MFSLRQYSNVWSCPTPFLNAALKMITIRVVCRHSPIRNFQGNGFALFVKKKKTWKRVLRSVRGFSFALAGFTFHEIQTFAVCYRRRNSNNEVGKTTDSSGKFYVLRILRGSIIRKGCQVVSFNSAHHISYMHILRLHMARGA